MRQTFIISVVFMLVSTSALAVTPPWSTTFNCSDWNQSMGNPVNCDGLNLSGGWTCDATHKDQIRIEANNPYGNGGKGFTHWKGDGINVVGGGISIPLSSTTPEFWLRFYMRYAAGFAWNSLQYDKIIYLDPTGNQQRNVFEPVGMNQMRFYNFNPAWSIYSANGTGFQHINGGSIGDGQFHCYEIHLRVDTNGSNGIAQAWVDGVQIINGTNVNFGTHSGWTNIVVGENVRDPNNGGCTPTDYDDIAISTTGYIGPLAGGGGGGTPPKTPSSPGTITVSPN